MVALITPFGKPPGGYAPTLTVNVTGSLMVLPMLVVRVHFRVLKVQLQPLVESVSETAVRPCGNVIDMAAEGSIAVLALVFVISMVTTSAESFCFTINGLGLNTTVNVGKTLGGTNADRSKKAYSSIPSCALIGMAGHSAG